MKSSFFFCYLIILFVSIVFAFGGRKRGVGEFGISVGIFCFFLFFGVEFRSFFCFVYVFFVYIDLFFWNDFFLCFRMLSGY